MICVSWVRLDGQAVQAPSGPLPTLLVVWQHSQPAQVQLCEHPYVLSYLIAVLVLHCSTGPNVTVDVPATFDPRPPAPWATLAATIHNRQTGWKILKWI